MSTNIKLDAERTILGSILLDQRRLYDCAALRPEYFGLQAHQQIFAAMLALNDKGRQIDTVTLTDALGDKADAMILSDLLNGTVERPNVKGWAEIVRDAAQRRYLSNSCQSVIAKLQDPANDTDGLIDEQESLLLRLRAAGTVQTARHVKEVMPTVLNEMVRQWKHKGELVGLTTGIETLDYTTTGIRPGEYWVIGAAPSRGKTVFGAQIVASNACQGVPSLVFSYEMSKEQFVKRLIPNHSGIPAEKVRDFRNARETQIKEAGEAGAQIAQWPFWVCDPEGMTAHELCAVAKLHIRRHGIKLIVVDYLQIIDGEEREIRTRVGAVSNTLRSLAKTEQVSVVALSQLRRPQDENERPTMFHLKESGDIEAHAHTICLIYRPKDEQGRWSGCDEIIVAKQREGLVGSEPVLLDAHRLWFAPRMGKQ